MIHKEEGFLIARKSRKPDGKYISFVQDCYVLPEHRGKGLGRKWAKELGTDCVAVVPKENLTAKLSVHAQKKAGARLLKETENEVWMYCRHEELKA